MVLQDKGGGNISGVLTPTFSRGSILNIPHVAPSALMDEMFSLLSLSTTFLVSSLSRKKYIMEPRYNSSLTLSLDNLGLAFEVVTAAPLTALHLGGPAGTVAETASLAATPGVELNGAGVRHEEAQTVLLHHGEVGGLDTAHVFGGTFL